MTITGAIYSQLAADAGVQAIAGDPVRIYLSSSDEGIYPLATIDVEDEPDDAISKRALQEFTVSIEAAALSTADAQALADAIRQALDRQTWTHGTISVASCMFNGASTSSYSDAGNVDRMYHLVEQHYSVLASGI